MPPRRSPLVALLALPLLVLALLAAAHPSAADERPSFVVYVLDDADARLFEVLPRLVALGQEAMRFAATAPAPVCAPSRASILTGLHVHNHDVRNNSGDADAWAANGNGKTIADWLQAAGYTTARFGKWINGVPRTEQLGWNVTVDVVGRRAAPGGGPYWLDTLTQEAVRFAEKTPGPLFVYFAPASPHKPFIPAPAYLGRHEDVELPRPPSFNEPDMSDKRWKVHPPLTEEEIAAIAERHRRRREMMESVVDSIAALRSAFASRPTYLLITSDHGYFEGQHRYEKGKGKHFEEAIRVPLWVLGPTVQPGASPALVYPLDIAPTVAELAGVTPPELDGRSLVPLLSNPRLPWRKRVLLAHHFRGVRTPRKKLVVFRDERELYDLRRDPFELQNRCRAGDDRCGRGLARLATELARCRGATCWEIETRGLSAAQRARAQDSWLGWLEHMLGLVVRPLVALVRSA